MTRRERIRLLLDNYLDVVNGLRDGSSDGVHLPLMCACWNHPSYRQLEQLRLKVRLEQPALYLELRTRFFDTDFQGQRTVLACQVERCSFTLPTWATASFHRHGRRNVALVPKTVRLYRGKVDEQRMEQAIEWLDDNWQGGVFVPDELLLNAA